MCFEQCDSQSIPYSSIRSEWFFTCFLLGLKLQENESYCGLIVRTFKPQLVAAVRNESLVDELKKALADVEEKPEIIPGEQGVVEVK